MRRSFRNRQISTVHKGPPSRRRKAVFWKLAGVVSLASLLALLYTGWLRLPERSSGKKENPPASALDTAAFRNDLSQFFLREYFPPEWIDGLASSVPGAASPNRIDLTIRFPQQFAIHSLAVRLLNFLENHEFHPVESYENLLTGELHFLLSRKDGTTLDIRCKRDANLEWFPGEVAVIIDDFGYHLDSSTEKFFRIPFPVTFAIIPGTEYAREIAQKAAHLGYDVLIHLPMEPEEGKVEQKGYTIMTGMTASQMERVLKRALEQIPGAVGVNNHMGSKATADRRTMARFMQVLKKYNLIFVDSFTTRKSVAYRMAVSQNVPALKLTTYLDNRESSLGLAQKLEEVVKNLPKEKNAVVIGHARAETARLLPAEMARWAFRGVRFVRLRQLLNQ